MTIKLVYIVHERPTGGILYRAEETSDGYSADVFAPAMEALVRELRDGVNAEMIIAPMRDDVPGGKPTFWEAFDKVEAKGLASPVGKIMAAAGYAVQHTGGGCMAWQRDIPKGYVWICDLGNGLGDTPDEGYLCGVYSEDGDTAAQGDAPNLAEALAWADSRVANLLGSLTAEYDIWLKQNGLPSMSADDLVCEEDKTTKEQRLWLRDFVCQWEASAALETAARATSDANRKAAQDALLNQLAEAGGAILHWQVSKAVAEALIAQGLARMGEDDLLVHHLAQADGEGGYTMPEPCTNHRDNGRGICCDCGAVL